MQKASPWMGRTYRSSALVFLTIGLCSSASSMEQSNPVREFAQNPDYCHYMMAPPGGADDEFESRYSAALQASLNFLRQLAPDMTKLDSLLWLREQCETATAEAAQTPKQ